MINNFHKLIIKNFKQLIINKNNKNYKQKVYNYNLRNIQIIQLNVCPILKFQTELQRVYFLV